MFSLDEVVPWGRSFDEYRRMFALANEDLARRILGCGDGPASFNAEATRRGARIVSCDPIYRVTADQLRDRIAATHDRVIEETRRNTSQFVWDTITSVDELARVRMAAMEEFLEDYQRARGTGRYVAAELPHVPFVDDSFDLALSSHFLFLYGDHLGEAFHRAAIRDMCRVAAEVRIFPLLTLGGRRSAFVDTTVSELTAAGYEVSVQRVEYEFQRGGNEMMHIRRGPANTHSFRNEWPRTTR